MSVWPATIHHDKRTRGPYLGDMSVDYACEFCGFAGRDHSESDADLVQCSQCGEMVVPLGARSGIATDWDD